MYYRGEGSELKCADNIVLNLELAPLNSRVMTTKIGFMEYIYMTGYNYMVYITYKIKTKQLCPYTVKQYITILVYHTSLCNMCDFDNTYIQEAIG